MGASIISRSGWPAFPAEYPVEDAEATPADEAVVGRLVRAVFLRRVPSTEVHVSNVNDAAHDPEIIDTLDAVVQREKRNDPALPKKP